MGNDTQTPTVNEAVEEAIKNPTLNPKLLAQKALACHRNNGESKIAFFPIAFTSTDKDADTYEVIVPKGISDDFVEALARKALKLADGGGVLVRVTDMPQEGTSKVTRKKS